MPLRLVSRCALQQQENARQLDCLSQDGFLGSSDGFSQLWSFADTVSPINDGSSLLEANFIHERSYDVDGATVNRSDVFRSCRVRNIVDVRSFFFVLNRD